MFALKEFRSTAQAFPDILNYASFIDDGVLLNKDGSLTAGFYYRAGDISSMTLNDRNSLSARINALLARLGNGCAVHIDCSRIKTENYLPGKTHYKAEISQLLENERKSYFDNVEHFENLFTMIFTYLPLSKNVAKIVDMMVISLARGYHVNTNVDKDGKENEIDSIMNQIKKGTDK